MLYDMIFVYLFMVQQLFTLHVKQSIDNSTWYRDIMSKTGMKCRPAIRYKNHTNIQY